MLDINKGDRYNKLVIIEELMPFISKQNKQVRIFKCKCDCGNIKNIRLANIRNGHIKSCGCLYGKLKTIHGMTGSRIFNIWVKMKQRCININNRRYKDYGGRGITYDSRWEKFENFYEDMKEGYADNLSIDRINNDGNYCKENCRWATIKEQARNKRNNVLYKGKCISQLCEELKIDTRIVFTRLHRGWDIEKALELK